MTCYEDLTKSLNEAVKISQGETKVVPKEGFENFYTVDDNSKDAKTLSEWKSDLNEDLLSNLETGSKANLIENVETYPIEFSDDVLKGTKKVIGDVWKKD